MLKTLSILAILAGLCWTLQGLGWLAGRRMADRWDSALIGAAFTLVGVVLLLFALRRKKPA